MGVEITFMSVMEAGVLPFIAGGVIKAAVAAVLIPATWALVRKVDAGKNTQS
jgi:biotin transport system substrate-specific component